MLTKAKEKRILLIQTEVKNKKSLAFFGPQRCGNDASQRML